MDMQDVVKNLHPLEVKIIRHYGVTDELTIEKVERELSLKAGNGNQALSWLAGKGIVTEIRRETAFFFELTELGKAWQEKGAPEERILELVRIKPADLPEIARTLGLDPKYVGSAFGKLAKLGVLGMDGEKRAALALPPEETSHGRPVAGAGAEYLKTLRALLDAAARSENGILAASDLSEDQMQVMAGIVKKRGAGSAAFRDAPRETAVFGFTADRDAVARALENLGVTGEECAVLTAEMLADGSWREKRFRPYNVKVPPARMVIGRTNPYGRFLEGVKDKLVSLGFEEFDGPLVETEFWNSDALFMPQFHSARDIHDVYHIAEPEYAAAIEEPWLSQVAATHENGGATGSRGWNYAFDRTFTRRLILRSQGTVMSAKTLPRAAVPGKYFGMLRCFRYDRVDATHLSDFYQTEGIVLGEEVNIRTLLGFLEMFALEVAGAKEVKYVPGYFPFTEPSVEVHIRHPVLGWFELGGSGIFRPEVTEALGVKVPVAAWGIGIDRMALMALGLNDLRDLFSYDIESTRLRQPAAPAAQKLPDTATKQSTTD
ncbi:MAG: phenylalanine--tRNA ligase subunit alpha [Spirochaetaceae bacterium]|jgi:phenylalanyl-tRNA synthetase alpha chain|nr:phenylalanine--tRNA ligase subunit alpha [Spirochaetaceae bacterium]